MTKFIKMYHKLSLLLEKVIRMSRVANQYKMCYNRGGSIMLLSFQLFFLAFLFKLTFSTYSHKKQPFLIKSMQIYLLIKHKQVYLVTLKTNKYLK